MMIVVELDYIGDSVASLTLLVFLNQHHIETCLYSVRV